MKLFIMAVSTLFALGVLLSSDTATDFSQRYGPPIRETYLVRPGIVATVSYGKSGHACEIVIGPNQSGEMIKSRGVSIESKRLTDTLDEIVPTKERGEMRMGEFVNLTCLPSNDCYGTKTDWDKVTIYRNGGTDNEHYATIQWRRDECRRGSGDPHVSNP
jgi:hypothetical protein